MDQIVVDIFDAGQAYVAFSRVKTLEGLLIKNFKSRNIRVNADMSEMKKLSNQSLQSEPVPSNNWMKISHLNVHSYFAKWEDIKDQAMRQTNILCFTETFLRHHQHLEQSYLPTQNESEVFRLDRLQTNSEDLTKGGIMIVCPSSLQPVRININHPNQLEAISIIATSTNSGRRMCIVAIYRHPCQPLTEFLPLISNYVTNLPNIIPTIILGDFKEDLLSRSTSSVLVQLMSDREFHQLVHLPTTDSGSLLDHIYYNGNIEDTFVDVIDTYYSDHDATHLSLSM